jgi:RNase P/RNase MRP subunit p29
MKNKDQSYEEWEGDVVYELENLLEITTSDAQGIVESHPFKMHQSWGKGLNAKETAKLVEIDSRKK